MSRNVSDGPGAEEEDEDSSSELSRVGTGYHDLRVRRVVHDTFGDGGCETVFEVPVGVQGERVGAGQPDKLSVRTADGRTLVERASESLTPIQELATVRLLVQGVDVGQPPSCGGLLRIRLKAEGPDESPGDGGKDEEERSDATRSK